MRVAAVVLAAGSGTRFGQDKTVALLRGKPLWRWSFDAFRTHPRVESVGIVCSSDNFDRVKADSEGASFVALGGSVRQESSRIAVDHTDPEVDIVLIHDAARPLISHAVIDRVIDGIARAGAAAPGLPITDTVKEVLPESFRTLDRRHLFTVQTPQGARRSLLAAAHGEAKERHTDELALIEAMGVRPEIVEGDIANLKVTSPEDLRRAEAQLGPAERRTGIGYDVHRFSEDPARPLVLGGEIFEGHRGLEGHSDADVLFHAVVDALLGAAGLGDIGQHFPNDDARWTNAASSVFLRFAARSLSENGWRMANVDVTMIAESPKVMPRAAAIRQNLADALGIEPARVNVKATTNETLGAIGRGEGIAAFAVATIAGIDGG